MKSSKNTRRAFNVAAVVGVATLAGITGITALQAQQKSIKIGITSCCSRLSTG